MANADDDNEKKKGRGIVKWLLIAALILSVGGGAFYISYSGLITSLLTQKAPLVQRADGYGLEFIELDPIAISVGKSGSIKQLRFRAFIQIPKGGQPHILALQPRILDIIATYLRAIEIAQLEEPTSLFRIRAQLLRRIQLLTGTDAASDLLITEFILTS